MTESLRNELDTFRRLYVGLGRVADRIEEELMRTTETASIAAADAAIKPQDDARQLAPVTE